MVPQIKAHNRHINMYLFCTDYVPIGFKHTIGTLILHLTENLEIFNVLFL